MPVVGVLAEADVGGEDEIGYRVLDGAERGANGSLRVPGGGALGVLGVGDAEEDRGADAGFPGTAKRGSMRSEGSMRVSRTSERRAAVRRKRRGRLCGKLIALNATAVALLRAMKPPSGPELEAQPEGRGVVAALDEERPVRAVDDGRIGEGGVPPREVVSDIDRH